MNKRKEIEQPDNIEFIEKVAQRIRELRIANGYSNQEHFAWEHQISRSQYGKYEKGENMQLTSLARIIKALNTTPKEFFSEGFD